MSLSFYHGATLSTPAVERLIAAALVQAERPMPESGRGELIIKPISATQRARR